MAEDEKKILTTDNLPHLTEIYDERYQAKGSGGGGGSEDFYEIDLNSLGLDPQALENFFSGSTLDLAYDDYDENAFLPSPLPQKIHIKGYNPAWGDEYVYHYYLTLTHKDSYDNQGEYRYYARWGNSYFYHDRNREIHLGRVFDGDTWYVQVQIVELNNY